MRQVAEDLEKGRYKFFNINLSPELKEAYTKELEHFDWGESLLDSGKRSLLFEIEYIDLEMQKEFLRILFGGEGE